MQLEFIRLSRENRPPMFMVWDARKLAFEELNGRSSWDAWAQFVGDLRQSLGARSTLTLLPGEDEDDLDEVAKVRLDRAVKQYERIAPQWIRNAGMPGPPEPSRTRSALYNLGVWSAMLLVLLVLVSGFWTGIVHPVLGRMGIVEYTSPTQERYSRFLASAEGCTVARTVSSGRSNRFPAFQVYRCTNGEERVWINNLERVGKTAEGKWILD